MNTDPTYGWIAVLAALFAATAAIGEEQDLPVAPDALVYCTVCHGVQLMGNSNLEAPRLSGMDAWYVEQQLHAFKRGWRGTHPDDLAGMEMRPMAGSLSDQQIEDAGEFVSATRSPLPEVSVDGDLAAGKKHYSTCAACHGVNAEGNETLGAPALTGMNDWYLLRQLAYYRNGVRGSDPADTYGQQMAASTQLLDDDQAILDVVTYITSLPTH
jgi:cytochrome c oxidase subunit 2